MSIRSTATSQRVSSLLVKNLVDNRNSLKLSGLARIKYDKEKKTNFENILHYGDPKEGKLFFEIVTEANLSDTEIIELLRKLRDNIELIKSKNWKIIETILKLNCYEKSAAVVDEFQLFLSDVLTVSNKHALIIIKHIIQWWVPRDNEDYLWINGKPSPGKSEIITYTHKTLLNILDLMPMVIDIVLETIESCFPYFSKPPHVLAGYINNLILFMESKRVFETDLLNLMFKKLLEIDVYASRADIEEANLAYEEEVDMGAEATDDGGVEKEDPENRHPQADTLDLCLRNILDYIQSKSNTERDALFSKILNVFESVILLAHNPHHIQFALFYFTSLKTNYSDDFLKCLWSRVCNPNVLPSVRATCVSYIGSFLARAKFVPLLQVQSMLKDLCLWAHQYIERSDSVKSTHSFKSHLVFYSVCQAIFYLIAFRGKHLTGDNKNLLFLQSLQLSSLVTCQLNPLRVCFPSVVKAFAGLTRSYQLAYCHTIIEKNNRKELATVYGNQHFETPEEILNAYFPFDPLLLKRCATEVRSIYLTYEDCNSSISENIETLKRKRLESMNEENDDIDDFLIECKKNKGMLMDSQFSYEVHPGFHK